MNDSAIGWALMAKGMQALRRLKGSKLSPVTDSDRTFNQDCRKNSITTASSFRLFKDEFDSTATDR